MEFIVQIGFLHKEHTHIHSNNQDPWSAIVYSLNQLSSIEKDNIKEVKIVYENEEREYIE